jgi:cytochrome c oxidase assembly protein Cox11
VNQTLKSIGNLNLAKLKCSLTQEKQLLPFTKLRIMYYFLQRFKEKKPIIGFATYSVFPEEASLYFSKV